METTYFSLGSKASFNRALRHFFKVTEAVDEVESHVNIADFINELLDEEELHEAQILPMIGSVIRDKFAYSTKSINIPAAMSNFDKIINETVKWTALDIVAVYFTPDGHRAVINPKSLDSWERVRELSSDQLIVVYIKNIKDEDLDVEIEALTTLEDLIYGKDVFSNKKFIDQTLTEKPKDVTAQEKAVAAQPQAKSKKKRNITPKYGVQVSNELFHNGNVEAWKKIVESYQTKYPELEVHIVFEGEVINDINSLFKWGKVKHGDTIFFQVSGEHIKGVSKLQKYLYEGASHRFEQFLKLGIGKVLNLF